MDRQWRPRPIQANANVNVCPNCLTSHSPFCPPPPATYYPQPFQGDHYFQPRSPYPPTNPNWDSHTFRPPYDHPNPNGDGDRNFKRPRIDDSVSVGTYPNDYDKNPPPTNFSEDERRLKLIRDHGVALAKPLQELHHSYATPVVQHNHLNQNGFPSDLSHGDQFKTSAYPFHSYGGSSNLDPLQQQRVAHPVEGGMNAPYQYHEQIGVGDPNKLLPRMEVNFPSQDGNHTQHGASKLNGRVVHYHYHYPYPYPYPTGSSNISDNMGQVEASRFFRGLPPLPSSPPPPLPLDPPLNLNHNQSSQLKTYVSPPKKPASLFPVPVSSSTAAPSSYSQIPEAHSLSQPYFHSKPLPQFSTGFPPEEPSKHYFGDAQPFSLKRLSAEKPKFIDASRLFRHPHRTSRPDHFVIIFRGLPGSGKSYLAKMLRDLEVENGSDAPRIHSLDDYFMTEVEKFEDNDASKTSSSGRNKKPVTKKVMEYCYEPEMEEAYRSSMLKAFKKTVEEGVFTFIIVDDRNLRVADFAQFWATAKRSGYEVYILEATYKDPVGCAARNVHGFTQEDIEKMAGQWEEAPSLYLQLDVKSLFHGDDLKESRIQEVEMDMEDDLGDALPAVQGREAEKVVDPPVRDDESRVL